MNQILPNIFLVELFYSVIAFCTKYYRYVVLLYSTDIFSYQSTLIFTTKMTDVGDLPRFQFIAKAMW